LLGSARPVPREDCFQRWLSMAWRVLNSLEQWTHLGIFEPCSLGKARLSSWSHNARKQPVGPWDIPMQAGQCRQETTRNKIRRKLRITEKQSICCVPRMPRAVSVANLCSSHGKWENLHQQNMQRVCHWKIEMTTWIYKNDYIEQNQNILREMSVTRWVVMQLHCSIMQGAAQRNSEIIVELIWTSGPADISCDDQVKEAFANMLAWDVVHIAFLMEFIVINSSLEIFHFLIEIDKTSTCCRGGNGKCSAATKRLKSKPKMIVIDGIANAKRESVMYRTWFESNGYYGRYL
jgi:hypothetical protein